MIRLLTRTHSDTSLCHWHGELIKMMFSLRGALRSFALLWLFNLPFAMLVIAFTHSSPIFRNGSSNSHTHTHSQFRFCIWKFLHFYGFILSLKPFSVRSLTIGNTHRHHQAKKKEKRGDGCQRKINFTEHQIEKLILQDFLLCKLRNARRKILAKRCWPGDFNWFGIQLQDSWCL